MAKNHEFLPTKENYGDFTTEEEIYRVRVTLWHEKKRFDLYKGLVTKQSIPAISEAMLTELVASSTQKKYRDRYSPPPKTRSTIFPISSNVSMFINTCAMPPCRKAADNGVKYVGTKKPVSGNATATLLKRMGKNPPAITA
jgi:hypothetical protein